MKITAIKATPMFCAFKQPYHWAQGVNYGAPVILIEVETDRVGREPDLTGIGVQRGLSDGSADHPHGFVQRVARGGLRFLRPQQSHEMVARPAPAG